MHTVRSIKWKYKQMYAFGDKEYFDLTLFKLPSVNAARFLKYVWSFFSNMHERVKCYSK